MRRSDKLKWHARVFHLGHIFQLKRPPLFPHLSQDCCRSVFKCFGRGHLFQLYFLSPDCHVRRLLEFYISERDLLLADQDGIAKALPIPLVDNLVGHWTVLLPHLLPVLLDRPPSRRRLWLALWLLSLASISCCSRSFEPLSFLLHVHVRCQFLNLLRVHSWSAWVWTCLRLRLSSYFLLWAATTLIPIGAHWGMIACARLFWAWPWLSWWGWTLMLFLLRNILRRVRAWRVSSTDTGFTTLVATLWALPQTLMACRTLASCVAPLQLDLQDIDRWRLLIPRFRRKLWPPRMQIFRFGSERAVIAVVAGQEVFPTAALLSRSSLRFKTWVGWEVWIVLVGFCQRRCIGEVEVRAVNARTSSNAATATPSVRIILLIKCSDV